MIELEARRARERYEALVASIVEGLEAYRPMIEGGVDLRNIQVVVHFDHGTGRPQAPIIRTESQVQAPSLTKRSRRATV